jgi:hypothetical protein
MFTDTEGLLGLVDKQVLKSRKECNNRRKYAEFVLHFADIVRKTVICEMQTQKRVSILVDALTDKGGTENLLLYARQWCGYILLCLAQVIMMATSNRNYEL